MCRKLDIFILEDAPERCEWFLRIFHGCNISLTDKVGEACEILRNNQYDIVFLDRDLGHFTENGEDVARVMKQERLCTDATIVIHTVNTIGQMVMKRYFENYSDVHVIPFSQLLNYYYHKGSRFLIQRDH